jgi:SAM-dependent methyltransferase
VFLSRTQFVPHNVLNVIKRSRPVYKYGRRLRFAVGSVMGARPLNGVRGRVHYNDFMLASSTPGDIGRYTVGADRFVDILEQSLRECGRDWESVGPVLEIGCGYGRVVRALRQRRPDVEIFVSDVIDEGARWVASEFSATRIPPMEQAGAKFNNRFGLVYLLSVYTHLRRDMVENNLRRTAAALRPGGTLVFTIHGQHSADTAERYNQYWLDKTRLLSGLATAGYYYERYPYYYDEYGLTWFTKEAVQELVRQTAPELKFVSHHPVALDEHQDVFVYSKA